MLCKIQPDALLLKIAVQILDSLCCSNIYACDSASVDYYGFRVVIYCRLYVVLHDLAVTEEKAAAELVYYNSLNRSGVAVLLKLAELSVLRMVAEK